MDLLQYAAVAMGVAVAHYMVSPETLGPPFGRLGLTRRAAFGWLAFMLVGMTVATAAIRLLGLADADLPNVRRYLTPFGAAFGISIVAGFLFSQAYQKRSNARHRPRLLYYVNGASELFVSYTSKLHYRAERVGTATIRRSMPEPELRLAIARLYEFHAVELARNVQLRAPKAHQASRRLSLLRARDLDMRIRLLYRHLGPDELARAVTFVAEQPQSVLPRWPSHRVDNRSAHNPLAASSRRSDGAYVELYVSRWSPQEHPGAGD